MTQESMPVLVRVKRKSFQEPLDTFWLEVYERPLKKALVGFSGLSISDSAERETAKTKKFLMQHVDTVENPEALKAALESFLDSDGAANKHLHKTETRKMLKQRKLKENNILSARREHENMARSARFEQIWRSRKKNGQQIDDSLREKYRLYDIMRIDAAEEKPDEAQKSGDVSIDETDAAILGNYLPLIKELLPSAAAEIESEVSKAGAYVYDIYAMEDDTDEIDESDLKHSLLVQVNDDGDDYYDGPSGSDYDTDDSNAYNSDLHDYPDEPSESECAEQSDNDDNESIDTDNGLEDSEFERRIDHDKGSDDEYDGPIDMEEFEIEMEDLRQTYL